MRSIAKSRIAARTTKKSAILGNIPERCVAWSHAECYDTWNGRRRYGTPLAGGTAVGSGARHPKQRVTP